MSIFEHFVRRSPEATHAKRKEQRMSELSKALAGNVLEDKARFPEDAAGIDACLAEFQAALRRHVESQTLPQEEDAPLPPVDATPRFCLSPDRMRAYAVLLPPLDGGRDIAMEGVLEDLRYDGVCHGVMEELAARQVEEKWYLHIFPIAAGTPPVDGTDGQISDLFARRTALQMEAEEGAVIDFRQADPIQAVRKGELICRITPPIPGTPGQDVTGGELPCVDGIGVTAPAGENTRLSDDGLLLLAAIDGAVVVEEGKFCVKRQQIILGNVDEAQSIHCPGDLYISGNVSGKAKVEAVGNIFIGGKVRDATVRSTGGSIRVQKGIQSGGAELSAARQLQALVIESAKVSAKGDIFAEVMVDSDVTSGGGVYVLGGRGLILGGHVRAERHVAAKRIGNLSNQRNQITVGYSPKLSQDIAKTEAQLSDVKATLEKLRKSVSSMRAAGELLSLEKRAVLAQLIEQRNLYDDQEAGLNKTLKELKQALHAAISGRVTCQELYPITAVRIGDRDAEFHNDETGCNIHVYAGRIVVK